MDHIKPFQIPKKLIWQAWQDVRKNAGAAGVDKQTIEAFEENVGKNLYKIWNRMSSGTYFPPAVKGVAIPKKSGGQRMLGIPTVADRVAQTVVKMVIEPTLEEIFLPDSYGYRAGRSAHDAIAITRKRCWEYDWVLEFDIKGLFDNINHGLLMRAVEKHTDCKWAILYIKRWLKAPMQKPDGTIEERSLGTPQGGVVSPVLSNLFMHYVFDVWMNKNFSMVLWCRYADDGLVHCKTLSQAQHVMEKLKTRYAECGLEMHPDKTKIVYCRDSNRKGKHKNDHFDFLGYCFKRRSAKSLKTNKLFDSFMPAMSPKAFKAIKETLRNEVNLNSKLHLDLKDIARELNPRVRGWINYYGKFYGSILNKLREYIDQIIEGWARRKFKGLNSKQRGFKWLERIKAEYPSLFVHWYHEKAF